MKKNAREEFLIASEGELKAAGLPGNQESAQFLRALAKGRVPQKLKHKSIVTLLTQGFLALVAETLRQDARKRKFKNKAGLQRALERIQGYRHQLRPATAEALSCIVNIPPQKKTGPEAKLRGVKKQTACSTIDTFITNGMTTKFAIAQTAKDYGVSPRMMRRAWESRGQS